MPKRPATPPEPPQPAPLPRWTIHKAAHRLIWVGDVEAPDEDATIAKAAEQLGLLPAKPDRDKAAVRRQIAPLLISR